MNHKKYRIFCTLLLVSSLLFSSVAYADVTEEKKEVEPAYDGFLVSIREGYWEDYQRLPRVFSVVAAKHVSNAHRIMHFSDLSVVQNWFPEEAIAFYEPNYYMYLLEEPINQPEPIPWNLDIINMDETKEYFDGNGIRVAIIDTGIRKEYPDLNWNNIESGWNYADNNDKTDDFQGHGTFVAGVIGAIPQNGNMVDGVAPAATIVPLKVIKSDGSIPLDNVILAIEEAVSRFDCDVINISLGTKEDSVALRTIIESIPEDVIIVAAAGNDGDASYQYPAAYPRTIAVGSLNQEEIVSVKSQKNDQLTIVAPGESLTGLGFTSLFQPINVTGSGTSYAAPHVTGAAALAKQAKPTLTAQEFQEALIETAKDLGEVGYDTSYGYGLIQIDALMDRITTFRMTSILISESEQSKTWQLDLYQMPIGETVEVLISGYQVSGRMESLLFKTAIPDEFRRCQLLVEIPFSEETDRIKVFFLTSLSQCLPRWPNEVLYESP